MINLSQKVLSLLTLAALLLPNAQLCAQESETGKNNKANQQSEQQETAQPKATTAPEQPPVAQKSSSETFTPTEEISEDLSVSFPVDI